MARKKNSRRAISVKGLTYQRLKKYCEGKGRSLSGFLEEIIAERLDKLGVPEETELEERPRRPEPSPQIVGNHFTF